MQLSFYLTIFFVEPLALQLNYFKSAQGRAHLGFQPLLIFLEPDFFQSQIRNQTIRLLQARRKLFKMRLLLVE